MIIVVDIVLQNGPVVKRVDVVNYFIESHKKAIYIPAMWRFNNHKNKEGSNLQIRINMLELRYDS